MPVVKKPISRRVERTRPQRIKRTLELKEFYEKRNKVLISRNCGGLGDILMHRMMFEDFKLLAPDLELHFACPKQYHDVVKDHPFVDKVLDVHDPDRHDYIVSYNTTTACGRHEMKVAPESDKHRSDIWANHCGLELTKHDMHFQITENEKEEGKKYIEEQRDRPGKSVLIAPISAMLNKNLPDGIITDLFDKLRNKGFFPFALHKSPIGICFKENLPMISGTNLRQWLGIINQADYVISVDTSVLHASGGMGKPLVGVFTFINSKIYSRYYETSELVQGPCPIGYMGCYNWGDCPYVKDKPLLPCCSGLTTNKIMRSFNKIVERFPY